MKTPIWEFVPNPSKSFVINLFDGDNPTTDCYATIQLKHNNIEDAMNGSMYLLFKHTVIGEFYLLMFNAITVVSVSHPDVVCENSLFRCISYKSSPEYVNHLSIDDREKDYSQNISLNIVLGLRRCYSFEPSYKTNRGLMKFIENTTIEDIQVLDKLEKL